MAYTDPNTGITRDKYGNEVRDTTLVRTPASCSTRPAPP